MTYSHASSYTFKKVPICFATTKVPFLSTNNKHIYMARDNLLSNKLHKRSRTTKMQQSLPARKVFLIFLLLSFVPYFAPDDKKPSFYRSKTREELEARKRDRFIGGKIDELPFI